MARTRSARKKSQVAKSKLAQAALATLKGRGFHPGARVLERGLESARPTHERMAKGDVSVDGNRHQAEDTLRRLHRLESLDPHADYRERMYEAGKSYRNCVDMAGLSGISAQDVSRTYGGDGEPAYMVPSSFKAAAARQRWRKAWGLMGSKVAPTVHAILVEGRSPVEAGMERGTYSDPKYAATEALTILRVGLWILSEGWA